MADYRRKNGLTSPAVPYKPQVERRAVCGTRGGYNRHRRLGEPPCPACKKANSRYQTAYARGMRMVDPLIEKAMRAGM